MATDDSQLCFEEIRAYLVACGGKVSNREALRHFKRYLTDPATQVSARAQFKHHVNTLASIRTENNEKCLILRPKYYPAPSSPYPTPTPPISTPTTSYCTPNLPLPAYDPINSVGIPSVKISPHQTVFGYGGSSTGAGGSPIRQPPPYRAPPPFTPPSPQRPPSPSGVSVISASGSIGMDTISVGSSQLSMLDSGMGSVTTLCDTPKVPPRRRSSDKSLVSAPIDIPRENERPLSGMDKQTVSVKERTQKFNRLASVDDELSPSPKNQQKTSQRGSEKGAEEPDDRVSVTSLEPKKCREWYVTAAKADYLALSKLAMEEPLLVKVKDPFSAYTVLHWAAKHGNSDIIKLFAGTYRANVNARTNGGYTPLHLAAQYGHDDVFELLIKVYKADFNIADFSGRTPEKYRLADINPSQKQTHKFKGRKKQSDKDRFLRIGSLNVRVKKTTEAFSNFLGVGSTAIISNIEPISEKVHKGWGSADNVQKDNLMAAPKSHSTKRKHKQRIEITTPLRPPSVSNPGTPNQPMRSLQQHRASLQDSDSDTAAGFDSQWH